MKYSQSSKRVECVAKELTLYRGRVQVRCLQYLMDNSFLQLRHESMVTFILRTLVARFRCTLSRVRPNYSAQFDEDTLRWSGCPLLYD